MPDEQTPVTPPDQPEQVAVPQESIAQSPEPAPEPVATSAQPESPLSEPAPESPTPVPEPELEIPEQPETTTIQTNPPPAPQPQPPQPQAVSARSVGGLLIKARATIQTRKHKKLDRIMAEAEAHGKITNDEVQALLHVGDTTATRYLAALVKEGKLKRVGTTGKAVRYEKV